MLGTLRGLTANGMGFAFYSMHLAVMALGLFLLARTAWHHFRSLRRPEIEPVKAEIPRSLKVLTGAAFAACLLLIITSVIGYGEGGPEIRGGQYTWVRAGRSVRTMTPEEYERFEAGVLRIFAAAWAAFSLMIAWAGQVVDTRPRRGRAPPAVAA
jgi:hypothetical protein